MSRAQQTDDSIITLLRTDHSLKIVKESVPGCDQPLLGDLSQVVFRPLVPVGFRKKVLIRCMLCYIPESGLARSLLARGLFGSE